MKLNNCDSQLEALPTYEQFPDDAIPRLEAFQERVRQAGTDSEEAAEHLRVATKAAAAGIPDEALLEAAGQVEEIRRGRGSFDGSIHDLPERQGDLQEMETSLSTGLAELGHQWKEADLEAFDASLVVRNQVNARKERLTESGKNVFAKPNFAGVRNGVHCLIASWRPGSPGSRCPRSRRPWTLRS